MTSCLSSNYLKTYQTTHAESRFKSKKMVFLTIEPATELGRNKYFVGTRYDKAWVLGPSVMGNDAVVYKSEYNTWFPSRPSEPTVDLWLMPSFFIVLFCVNCKAS